MAISESLAAAILGRLQETGWIAITSLDIQLVDLDI